MNDQSTIDERTAIAEKIMAATVYTDLFPDADCIKDVYRYLARAVHPDRVVFGSHAEATRVFQRLNEFKAFAERMRDEGRYGDKPIMATIRTRKAIHRVLRKVGTDDMAVYYSSLTNGTSDRDGIQTMLKVAKSAKDNDLMAQEARALKTLFTPDVDGNSHVLNRHYPVLYDSFLHSEGRRRANVTARYERFYSLEKLVTGPGNAISGLHIVWMFRRLLMALGHAHDQGLIHGAVTPDNILIGPEDHAVVLIDWCYSVVIDDESKTHIKAVVPMYRDLVYPQEVLDKKPPTPATDLYMAAATMLFALGPNGGKAVRTFLKGCLLTKQSMRPQNAWALLKEFDELLERIGEPFFPRRWVEFAVPTGIASP